MKVNARERAGCGVYFFVKRLLDIFFSAILLVLLCIPMLMIWCAVAFTSRGGGIFRQRRVGRGGRTFICYKFRTMYKHAPHSVPTAKLLNAKSYVTPVGKVLRRTSLDELPQLFNVLKGDMSIIGPRPLILEEKEVHSQRKSAGIYALRPGITGLSQINGRDELSDGEKVALDSKYLQEFGIMQDARILAGTLGKVLSGEGIADREGKKR